MKFLLGIGCFLGVAMRAFIALGELFEEDEPDTFPAVVTLWYPRDVQLQIFQDSTNCNGVFEGRNPTLTQIGVDISGNPTYASVCTSTIECHDLFARYGRPLRRVEAAGWPDDVLRHHCIVEMELR